MSREAFEMWVKRDSTLSVERDGEGYRDMDVYIQWRAWQAAQADAFERAEKVCEGLWYASECADAIHALEKEPTR
jgi:hypothetical protein